MMWRTLPHFQSTIPIPQKGEPNLIHPSHSSVSAFPSLLIAIQWDYMVFSSLEKELQKQLLEI